MMAQYVSSDKFLLIKFVENEMNYYSKQYVRF